MGKMGEEGWEDMASPLYTGMEKVDMIDCGW
jgi:hypothetical protein